MATTALQGVEIFIEKWWMLLMIHFFDTDVVLVYFSKIKMNFFVGNEWIE